MPRHADASPKVLDAQWQEATSSQHHRLGCEVPDGHSYEVELTGRGKSRLPTLASLLWWTWGKNSRVPLPSGIALSAGHHRTARTDHQLLVAEGDGRVQLHHDCRFGAGNDAFPTQAFPIPSQGSD